MAKTPSPEIRERYAILFDSCAGICNTNISVFLGVRADDPESWISSRVIMEVRQLRELTRRSDKISRIY